MENKCKNCINYVQHYVYEDNFVRQLDGVGHCKKSDEYTVCLVACESYKKCSPKKACQQQLKTAADYVKSISKNLKELYSVLKI